MNRRGFLGVLLAAPFIPKFSLDEVAASKAFKDAYPGGQLAYDEGSNA